MDYFNLAFIVIIAIQSIIFRKYIKNLNKKMSKEDLDEPMNKLEKEVNDKIQDFIDKTSESMAIQNIDHHTRMKELNIFSNELAKLQREEVLNLHTKINLLQKRLTKFGNNLIEIKEDVKLVAKNPNKARKKFFENDD